MQLEDISIDSFESLLSVEPVPEGSSLWSCQIVVAISHRVFVVVCVCHLRAKQILWNSHCLNFVCSWMGDGRKGKEVGSDGRKRSKATV